jgi:hypothetical protein
MILLPKLFMVINPKCKTAGSGWFQNKEINVLVATDIAARELIINYRL